MFRRVLSFDQNSFLEVGSRITGKGEELMLSIRGRKNATETTVASVLLNESQVELLKTYLADWEPEPLPEPMVEPIVKPTIEPTVEPTATPVASTTISNQLTTDIINVVDKPVEDWNF